jgi:hypothetical protein
MERAIRDGQFTGNTIRKKSQEIYQLVQHIINVVRIDVDDTIDIDFEPDDGSGRMRATTLQDVLRDIDYPWPVDSVSQFLEKLEALKLQLGVLRTKYEKIYCQDHHQRQELYRDNFLSPEELLIIQDRRRRFFLMLKNCSWASPSSCGEWQWSGQKMTWLSNLAAEFCLYNCYVEQPVCLQLWAHLRVKYFSDRLVSTSRTEICPSPQSLFQQFYKACTG